MTHFLLIRHAVNDYVKHNRLAGWRAGVQLSAEGRAQAAALGERLADERIERLYASPLERTMETAQAICQHHPRLEICPHEGIGEVRYGDWEGAKIRALARRKAWSVVQEYPSRARFPGGESMRAAQNRIIEAIEELALDWPGALLALVFHADLIRMALAHYLGTHLDNFQRIVIAPASISALSLGHSRPMVSCVNDVAHLRGLEKQEKEARGQERTGGHGAR